jgi:hypothetical protein
MRTTDIRNANIRSTDNVQDHPSRKMASGNLEASISAMSWTSILGGAAAAIAITMVLLILGSGLGLSSLSPWENEGPSPTAFTVVAAIWMIIVQWASAAIGGYLTGRLRTKWVGLHTDEVFFRDTAHGFLAWATATIVTALFLASLTASAVSGGARALGTVASGAAMGAAQTATENTQSIDPSAYLIDNLFRTDSPDATATPEDARAESTRILAKGMIDGEITPADRTRLARLVSDRTGLAEADAARRVDEVIAEADNAKVRAGLALDKAKKVAATTSIFTALSMLIGAFIASLAASVGGKHRDRY